MYNPRGGGGGHRLNLNPSYDNNNNVGGDEALHSSHFTRQRRGAIHHIRSSSGSSGGHLHDGVHGGVYARNNNSKNSSMKKKDFSHSKRTFRKQTLFGIVFGIVMMVVLAVGASWLAKVFMDTSANTSPSSLSSTSKNSKNKRAEHAGVFSPVAEGDSRVERFMAKSNCTLNFFLAWTTSAAKFSLRYRRTVESTLKFHPGACLIV